MRATYAAKVFTYTQAYSKKGMTKTLPLNTTWAITCTGFGGANVREYRRSRVGPRCTAQGLAQTYPSEIHKQARLRECFSLYSKKENVRKRSGFRSQILLRLPSTDLLTNITHGGKLRLCFQPREDTCPPETPGTSRDTWHACWRGVTHA